MDPVPIFTQSLLLACAVTLSGCASAPPSSPTPTATPHPSSTATVGFPTLVPTATVTPLASSTPAPGIAADAGPLLFQASFSPDEAWRLSSDADGGASLSGGSLVLAVSNIGAIDSGEVAVEFFADSASLGMQRIERVPAGPGRNQSNVQVRQPIEVKPGPHTFKAVISSASAATVLDGSIELARYVP